MSISSFIKSICVQPTIYWGTPVVDGYGSYTYAKPIQIYTRWEDKQKKIGSVDGVDIMSDAVILTTIDLEIDGCLSLGILTDDTSDTPQGLDGVFVIAAVSKIPMIKSTSEFVRTVYLRAT